MCTELLLSKENEICNTPNSQCCDTYSDSSLTPTNTSLSPPIFVPVKVISSNSERLSNSYNNPIENYMFTPITNSKVLTHLHVLSPISGSFDCDLNSEIDSPLIFGSLKNITKSSEECHSPRLKVDSPDVHRVRPESATNELPLTELNLALFTSEQDNLNSVKMSTNELPLCDINLQNFLDDEYDEPEFYHYLNSLKQTNKSNDDASIEVNWESENSDADSSSNIAKLSIEDKTIKMKEKTEVTTNKERSKWSQHRSFSDPNILETDKQKNKLLFTQWNESIYSDDNQSTMASSTLAPNDAPRIPFSFYPPCNTVGDCSLYDENDPRNQWLQSTLYARSPTNLLSFFTSTTPVQPSSPPSSQPDSNKPRKPCRSLSHPDPDVTDPTLSNAETSGNSGVIRRHRHSIAGQMSYYKLLHGFIGFPIQSSTLFKKIHGNANSLFSTAVISGSSSAPNLRDMIPSSATSSGNNNKIF